MSYVEEIEDDDAIEISWSETVLTVAVLAMTFQLWPNFYFKTADIIYDSLDLTTWSWKSYCVANILFVIALAIVRFRQNQA